MELNLKCVCGFDFYVTGNIPHATKCECGKQINIKKGDGKNNWYTWSSHENDEIYAKTSGDWYGKAGTYKVVITKKYLNEFGKTRVTFYNSGGDMETLMLDDVNIINRGRMIK